MPKLIQNVALLADMILILALPIVELTPMSAQDLIKTIVLNGEGWHKMKIEQAMTSQIYKLWQDGTTLKEISAQCHCSVMMVRNIISKTPKERICSNCGVLFKAETGKKFCTAKCQRVHNHRVTKEDRQNLKPASELKHVVEPLHIVNERARAMGMSYGEYMNMRGVK